MTIVIAGTQHLGVGLGDGRFLCKFLLQHFAGILLGTVKEPAKQAESENVAAFENRFVIHSRVGQSGLSHGGDRHLNNLGMDAEFLYRVGGFKEGFFKTLLLERVNIENYHPVGFQKLVALFESRGVHGNQHIALVARSVHAAADTHLKTAHTAKRALRGADFGRIVGEGGN